MIGLKSAAGCTNLEKLFLRAMREPCPARGVEGTTCIKDLLAAGRRWSRRSGKDLIAYDEDALRQAGSPSDRGRHQFSTGASGGTTGESPTLSHEEHLRVVAITIEESKGKVPVLAGAGGYDTHKVIEMAREIERMGADGILSVTPYYNKPTQEGLYHHYKAIASAISLPIILYNVPPRTNVNIDPATVRRLAEIENIIGVKEASGSIGQMTQVIR